MIVENIGKREWIVFIAFIDLEKYMIKLTII